MALAKPRPDDLSSWPPQRDEETLTPPPTTANSQRRFSYRVLQATSAFVLITLFLFFASGMYEEKIRYAHRWGRMGVSVGGC